MAMNLASSAIVFGALLTAFAFKLRAWARSQSPGVPQGARTA
jgi:hypothetical protein